ncbi:MAG: oxidoreductase [Actinomycetota bacterium]|nr:oxidoreductase [Actinomycetota bacterium]
MTGSTLLVLPAGLPWLLAAVLALLDGRRMWVGWLAVAGLTASFVSAVVLTLRVLREGPVEVAAGGWPEGVGIVLRADVLGCVFATVSVGVILASLVYEVFLGVRSRTFPALVLFMAAALSGLFLTGDVFNFYVFFEVSMTAAYVLVGYRERDYQVRGALIFATVNLLGSVVFLIAIAALYHVTGTLQMRAIAETVGEVNPNSLVAIAAAIFVAFALKLGLFPFHFWLPAVYVGSHASVAAILSGALANIGNYGLLRFGGGILPEQLALGTIVVLILGSASIVYGALQAISRRETTEVLAYSAIGQVGYVLVALGVGGPVGFSAAVVYALVNSLNKALLFLVAPLRGPLVGAAFAVGAFSVAGVPPTAGFVAKVAAFKSALAVGGAGQATVLVALIFLGGALSFVYAFQIYQRVFLAKEPQGGHQDRGRKTGSQATRLLGVSLAALVLAVGLWPEPLLSLGEGAAAVLTEGTGGSR